MKRYFQVASAAVLATLASLAAAVSIVDYSSIMTSVTGELTAGVGAAAIGIGVLWGARIGTRFVKGLLH